MARAKLLPARRTDKRWTWAITAAPDGDPLKVLDCVDDAALAAVRSALHSLSVPLAESPPLRLRLARHPLGDVLMINPQPRRLRRLRDPAVAVGVADGAEAGP